MQQNFPWHCISIESFIYNNVHYLILYTHCFPPWIMWSNSLFKTHPQPVISKQTHPERNVYILNCIHILIFNLIFPLLETYLDPLCLSLCLSISQTHTHTNIHTYIHLYYIYIYIFVCVCIWLISLVSLFNGKSTSVGYLRPKTSL